MCVSLFDTCLKLVLNVYLFELYSYFSGISAKSSTLIHEYANIFNYNEM